MPAFLALSVALQLITAGVAFAETANPSRAAAAPPPPVFSPFGPGYDPTRPAPTEPTTSGRGITVAKLVASGAAEVEELNQAGVATEPLFAVVLDVTLAANSTTAPLQAASVSVRPEKGDAAALFALCSPTAELESSVYRPLDAGLAAWHVAVAGRRWYCGGRTARLLIKLREGGVRLVNAAASEWKGPLLLLFHCASDLPREVSLAGTTVKLPEPRHDDAAR